jgi:hypothetical protein
LDWDWDLPMRCELNGCKLTHDVLEQRFASQALHKRRGSANTHKMRKRKSYPVRSTDLTLLLLRQPLQLSHCSSGLRGWHQINEGGVCSIRAPARGI